MLAFSSNEIIESAIQIEISGYEFYEKALQKENLSDKSRRILTRLRDEESAHRKVFENLRSAFDKANLYAAKDWEIVQDYIHSHAVSHVFYEPGSSIAMAAKARNEVEVLRFAIGFEKDTILYFTSIHKDMIDAETRGILRKIIDEEAQHVMNLRNLLGELSPGAISQ